jgi:hypothetical protein
MRSGLSLAKEGRATGRAESAVHAIATVRHTRVVARCTRDLERRCAKTSADRSAPCPQVLAITAPTHSRGNGRFSALPTHSAAEAPACYCHLALRGQSRARAAAQIVLLAAFPALPTNPLIERRPKGFAVRTPLVSNFERPPSAALRAVPHGVTESKQKVARRARVFRLEADPLVDSFAHGLDRGVPARFGLLGAQDASFRLAGDEVEL